MGGIKNKLNNKLSNKTLFKVPLWLKGDVRRKSDRGIVSDTNPLGSQLPSFSQPSEMLTRNISNTRKSNWWSLYASKTIGSLHLVTLTKYLSITCLSLAILSTIGLNIISSYSSSNILSNAEEVATLATGPVVSGPAEIAISIQSLTTPTSSPCDTSNSDICMKIPDDGGIATGGHTVSIDSSSVAGWTLSLSNNSDSKLINKDNSNNIDNGTATIDSLPITANLQSPTILANNTWGIALPYGTNTPYYSKEANYTSSDKDVLANNLYSSIAYFNQSSEHYIAETANPSTPGVESRNIYYAVRVDHPEQLLAGNYQAEVVYTATVNLPPTPTNLSVSPTTFEFDSCNDSLITIKGNNLSSAYEVYLQKSGTSDEANRLACTNLNLDSTNNQLTCNIPTSRDEVELNTTYDIYVISQAASPGVLKNAFTYTEPATGLSVKSDNENIIVDYDTNMIPVKYVDYDGNGGGYWQVVTDQEIEENTNNWFRYGETPEDKRWANAITVTAETRESYRKKQTGEDPDPRILPSDNPSGNGEANPEILGYWVYIPRYAYEVQRRDATDKNVDPQNFDIVFETTNDTVKTPAKCTLNTAEKLTADINSSILYQDCIKQLYGDKGLEYPGNDEDLSNGQTTWATHPAFSWGDTELNGIWVGKFEMTGTRTAPTVKPNQHANISEYIGNFYSMARSIGKEDKCNVGGDTIGGIEQNSHNLQTTKSHMLKNSEWGAITYLAHSKYGAGINTSISYDTNIQRNSAYPSSSADADGTSSRYGITGCGPAKANETSSRSTYPDGTALSADVIESPIACSQDLTRAYNGSLGVLSSTTNAVYGVYGLSGGAGEYVMGNRTASDTQTTTTDTKYFETPANATYVDLYVATPNGPFGTEPSWSLSNNEAWYNYDICTFETCGGTATYETITAQSASSNDQSWGGAYSNFVYDNDPWFRRGSYSYNIYASPFCINGDDGGYYVGTGSRAALLALPAGQ